jgi:hypothetical protein
MATVSEVKFGTFHEMIAGVAEVLGTHEARGSEPTWWKPFCQWFLPSKEAIFAGKVVAVGINQKYLVDGLVKDDVRIQYCDKIGPEEHECDPLAFLLAVLKRVETGRIGGTWEWYRTAAVEYASIVSDSVTLRTEAFESGPFVAAEK